jgi:transcriptional regulator with XRE-family HTH domain
MLALAKIMEVERLLAAGNLSHRKIAAVTGVSRATISGIASGRRPDYEALRRAREEKRRPPGPVGRCAECGALVYLPCQLCKMREAERQRLKKLRQLVRRRMLKRLLVEVWRASQQREASLVAEAHLASARAGGESDCK